jgi:proliferating cell nuclear antigen
MEARLKNDAAFFKRLIDAVKEMVTEVVLDCSENGIHMQAMDNSHIALIHFFLDASKAFSHYKCESEISIGINVVSLQKVLKLCNNEDVLTLQKNNNEDKLTLLFESPNGSKISQFCVSLLDIDQEQLGIPDVEYKTYFSMSSQELVRICRDFKDLANTVTISSDSKSGIKFSFCSDTTNGNVTLASNSSMDDDSLPPFIVKVNENTSASFSSKYLMLFTKGSLMSQVVNVSLSNDLPLSLEYTFQEGILKYFMAPKMEDS